MLEKIVLGVAGVAVTFALTEPVKADPVNLQLTNSFVGSGYTPDSFNAVYDPENANLSDGIDPNDIEQASNYVDWNFLQIYATDTGKCLTQDYRAFDPNSQDLASWDIKLIAEDYALMQGFTGTSRITLDDPNEIDNIPNDFNVYMRRFDENKLLEAIYNLRDSDDYTDPNNHTIDWSVTNALGNYGSLELVINRSMNVADINNSGNVDYDDFNYVASDWLATGGAYSGDLDGDGDVDIDDLGIFSDNWLWDRWEGVE